jgi:hypothetical protein
MDDVMINTMEDAYRIVYRREASGGADCAPTGCETAYLIIGDDAIYLAWTDYSAVHHGRYCKIVESVKRLIEMGGEQHG